MNTGQLGAFFEAHKPAVLGASALGVVGLALLNKRRAAAGGAAATGARPAGTIPAAAVVPATSAGGTYDSSAYDVYSALQSQLSPFLQAQAAQTAAGGSGITTPKDPIASSLFAPQMTGQYVGYRGDGSPGSNSINEIEGDGSLLHLDMPQWLQIIAANGGKEPTTTGFDGVAPSNFTTTTNLQNRINTAAGKTT